MMVNTMIDEVKVCLIGAGGIGSTLVHFLAPSLSKSKSRIDFHILDSDIVEYRNIQFQQFSNSDIGLTKVNCLSKSYSSGNFQIKAIECDLDGDTSLSCYDYVICAVDNAKARKLVHSKSKKWIDLRSTGDGCVYLTDKTSQNLTEAMTTENSRGSCQQEGAIESGFIEYGYAICAATGAQWLQDHLRFGDSNIIQGIQSIRFGQMNFPKMEAKA